MEEESSQELYAFWRYDLFPYVLGDKVERFLEDGTIVAKHYEGFTFNPLVIVPKNQGEEIKRKLDTLELEYNEIIRETNASYREKIKAIMPGITKSFDNNN